MLLEREKELGLLADLLNGVGSSGGKVVLVRGEAGIGKSTLVREFVGAHADKAHVLFGFCDDLLTPQPLGPFWDIAREELSLGEVLEKGDRRAVMEVLGHSQYHVTANTYSHVMPELQRDAMSRVGKALWG